jgi:hypothetical protein
MCRGKRLIIRRFLRWLIGYEEPAKTVSVKSDIQAFIEYQNEVNAQQNEHISNLIRTLDKIVTANMISRSTLMRSRT